MLDKETLEFRKKELIKMANLEGKEKSIAGTLSGGWKQRLALGCSLIHNPQLLILDEPTAGVDPVSRRDFWNTIIDLVKEGMTVLVTTHYMDEASVCDIIGFIYNGKLVTIDSIDNLYKKHKINNLEDIFIKYVKKFSNKEVVASFDDLKSLKNKEEE
jgi:ABC-2 type transport system ATP-binding protein